MFDSWRRRSQSFLGGIVSRLPGSTELDPADQSATLDDDASVKSEGSSDVPSSPESPPVAAPKRGRPGRPRVKMDRWTVKEVDTLRKLVKQHGDDWQSIAVAMPGRTVTALKSKWVTERAPTLHAGERKWTPAEDQALRAAISDNPNRSWQSVASTIAGRTGTECRKRWSSLSGDVLDKPLAWSDKELAKLYLLVVEHGTSWKRVAPGISARTQQQCANKWQSLTRKLGDKDAVLESLRLVHARVYPETSSANNKQADDVKPELVNNNNNNDDDDDANNSLDASSLNVSATWPLTDDQQLASMVGVMREIKRNAVINWDMCVQQFNNRYTARECELRYQSLVECNWLQLLLRDHDRLNDHYQELLEEDEEEELAEKPNTKKQKSSA